MANKIVDWIGDHPKLSAFATVFSIVLVLVMVWYWSRGVDFVEGAALDQFEKTLDKAMKINASDLVNWYRANIVIQSVLIITGLAATVSAAATKVSGALADRRVRSDRHGRPADHSAWPRRISMQSKHAPYPGTIPGIYKDVQP